MKLCKVIIPFTDKVTGEFYKENLEVAFSDERVEEIRGVNYNMVLVLSEVPKEPNEQEAPKKPKRKKKE